jgi:ribulose-phosphate 3-epimerase
VSQATIKSYSKMSTLNNNTNNNKRYREIENNHSAADKQNHKPLPIIAASILDVDKAKWGESLQNALDWGCDWIHCDVMDGHFVPALSFGPGCVGSLRKSFPDAEFDVHFMVTYPEKFIEPLREVCSQSGGKGGIGFTFHIEATEERGVTKKTIDAIKAAGMRCGLALSPDTPVEAVLPYGNDVDLILVMTVRPGLGGQSFMDMASKIQRLRQDFPSIHIQVDGGIKAGATALQVSQAGANNIVSGSGIFMAKDSKAAVVEMKKALMDQQQ